MGSFAGHVIPGTFFVLVGIWHLVSSFSSFLSSSRSLNPKPFTARAWHPFPLPGHWRYLELQVIIVGSFLDMVPVELITGTHFRPFENGMIAKSHLNNFEHAAMLLMFFLYAAIAYISEATDLLPLPAGSLHLLSAAAFSAELLLFFFHSTAHGGVEGHYHLLLSLLIAACVLFALLSSAFPRSFLLDAGGSAAVLFQGLWFYQVAFSLFGSLVPYNCYSENGGVRCESPEDEMRGMAIANLQFTCHMAVILVFGVALFGYINHIQCQYVELDSTNEEDGIALKERNGPTSNVRDEFDDLFEPKDDV